MSQAEEKILEMVQDGLLTSAEAARLLEALAERPDDETAEAPVAPDSPPPDLDWFRSFWRLPFLISTGLVLLAGGLIWAVWQMTAGTALFFGLLCLAPFLAGSLVAALLSFWSRYAYWLHVRVQEKKGKRIAISLPIPLALLRPILRLAGRYAGPKQANNLAMAAELLAAIGAESDPLYISVDDDDGDQVRVYIG
jgi:hypothetical protein